MEYHQKLQRVVLNFNLDLNIQNVESVWCRFSYFAGAFSTSREATKTVSLYTSTLNYLEAQHQNKPRLAPVLKLYSRTFKATPLTLSASGGKGKWAKVAESCTKWKAEL